MKRPQFLATLAALCAAPFISLSKEKPSLAGKINYAGKIFDPVIFRQNFRMSKEQIDRVHNQQTLEAQEMYIEQNCYKRIFHDVIRSGHLRKAKIVNPDGSVDYQYLLSVMPKV